MLEIEPADDTALILTLELNRQESTAATLLAPSAMLPRSTSGLATNSFNLHLANKLASIMGGQDAPSLHAHV